MFHGYMTHGHVKLYPKDLVEKDLVVYDSPMRRYCIASKGMEYLGTIEKMAELLPVVTKRAVASERLASVFLYSFVAFTKKKRSSDLDHTEQHSQQNYQHDEAKHCHMHQFSCDLTVSV